MKNEKVLGLLGPEGTFGEIAALKYKKISGKHFEFNFFNSHQDIINSLKQGKISEALVAVENMINGTVREVLDLIYENNLKIKQEIIIPVHLILASKNKDEKIEKIVSHPVAINQINKYLKKNYPAVKLERVESTAKAMELVSRDIIKKAGAVGPLNAVKKYNLKVIDKEIEDYKNNQTRFLILARKDARFLKNKKYKTSLVVYNKRDYPGLLFSILKHFAKAGINLTKIESRPTKRKLGTYIFYIDFTGHRKQGKIKKILDKINKKVTQVNILGSYSIDE